MQWGRRSGVAVSSKLMGDVCMCVYPIRKRIGGGGYLSGVCAGCYVQMYKKVYMTLALLILLAKSLVREAWLCWVSELTYNKIVSIHFVTSQKCQKKSLHQTYPRPLALLDIQPTLRHHLVDWKCGIQTANGFTTLNPPNSVAPLSFTI